MTIFPGIQMVIIFILFLIEISAYSERAFGQDVFTNIKLNEDVKIVFDTDELSPIEFIFITKGYFEYSENYTDAFNRLKQFQNTIISHKRNAKKTFLFPNLLLDL